MSIWLIILVTAVASYWVSLIVRVLTSREKKIEYRIEHLFSVADDQFLRSMCNLLPPAALGGNRVTALFNGDEFFPAMLDAICSARHTITFETFIYWQGDIGRQFAEALTGRARTGVKVHILLDWLGTRRLDMNSVRSMTDAGVEVERYHPLRWYNLRERYVNCIFRFGRVVGRLPGYERTPVPLDSSGMHQVLMNLLSNSLDTLPIEGGLIRIECRYDEDDKQAINNVIDNGRGILLPMRRHMFELFHSTKGNRGTDLGLAGAKR